MNTEEETARGMVIRYRGVDNASIHATYNLMLHDKGSDGYEYWVKVIELIYKGAK